jgi:hypothetical protein
MAADKNYKLKNPELEVEIYYLTANTNKRIEYP